MSVTNPVSAADLQNGDWYAQEGSGSAIHHLRDSDDDRCSFCSNCLARLLFRDSSNWHLNAHIFSFPAFCTLGVPVWNWCLPVGKRVSNDFRRLNCISRLKRQCGSGLVLLATLGCFVGSTHSTMFKAAI